MDFTASVKITVKAYLSKVIQSPQLLPKLFIHFAGVSLSLSKTQKSSYKEAEFSVHTEKLHRITAAHSLRSACHSLERPGSASVQGRTDFSTIALIEVKEEAST